MDENQTFRNLKSLVDGYCPNQVGTLGTHCPIHFRTMSLWIPSFLSQSRFQTSSHVRSCLSQSCCFLIGDMVLAKPVGNAELGFRQWKVPIGIQVRPDFRAIAHSCLDNQASARCAVLPALFGYLVPRPVSAKIGRQLLLSQAQFPDTPFPSHYASFMPQQEVPQSSPFTHFKPPPLNDIRPADSL
jgi:hypothetical protein